MHPVETSPHWQQNQSSHPVTDPVHHPHFHNDNPQILMQAFEFPAKKLPAVAVDGYSYTLLFHNPTNDKLTIAYFRLNPNREKYTQLIKTAITVNIVMK